jgi:NADH-quinone oxidoreductase subunit A
VSDFLRSYLTVAIFGLVALLLVGGILALGRLIRPSGASAEKLMTYESGVDPTGNMWSQSNIRYYVFALLFVMFDVEAVFLFPWATRLEAYGTFGLVEMGIFIVILLLGLLYAWRKGMLRWV